MTFKNNLVLMSLIFDLSPLTSGLPGTIGHPGHEGPKGQKGSQGTITLTLFKNYYLC